MWCFLKLCGYRGSIYFTVTDAGMRVELAEVECPEAIMGAAPANGGMIGAVGRKW